MTSLVQALAAQEIQVRPRRFESWGSEGLEASPDLAMKIQVAHYATLDELSASGRGSDDVALRMAARGFPCPKLRSAILQRIGLDDVTEVHPHELDLSTGESGDAGFAGVEQIAHTMADSSLVVPRPMSIIIDAMRRNSGRFAEQLGESPESLFHCVLVNGLCQMFGEAPYHPRAMVTALGINPDELGADIEYLAMEGPPFDVAEINDTYLQAPLDSIAAAAHWSRRYVPAILAFIDAAGVTEFEMDELAAVFAPVTVYGLRVLQRLSEQEMAAVHELPNGSLALDLASESHRLAG